MGPGIEPTSSWILIAFVTAEPQRKLPEEVILSTEMKLQEIQSLPSPAKPETDSEDARKPKIRIFPVLGSDVNAFQCLFLSRAKLTCL